jgi:hypothetical protein
MTPPETRLAGLPVFVVDLDADEKENIVVEVEQMLGRSVRANEHVKYDKEAEGNEDDGVEILRATHAAPSTSQAPPGCSSSVSMR